MEERGPDAVVAPDGGNPVVLFDGVCNLCNAAVVFIIRRDRAGRIRFAPLPAQAAGATAEPRSVLWWENGRVYEKSDALLRIARQLPPPWPLLGAVFALLPRGARDAVYDFVAHRRYRWFGRRDTCMVPADDLRCRFLDAPPRGGDDLP